MLPLLIVFSYLMGSIPTGYILVKKKLNKDVRDYGSGNIGATNVRRIPVLLTRILIWTHILNTNESLSLSLVAIAAILGHNYTIFLKFKGGKGVATSAAAFMIVVPIPFIITAIIFFGLKLFTKIVSIRSLAAGVTLFLSTLLLGYDKYYVYATLFACLLVFWRHKANIVRLIKGEEK